MIMVSKPGFPSLSPSSIQLLTPSKLTANEAMFVYKADKNMEKMYHAVVKKINNNKANFGEAAATLLIFRLRLRNKKHYLLVHKETAFSCGNLGGRHGYPAILLILSKYSKVNVEKIPWT